MNVSKVVLLQFVALMAASVNLAACSPADGDASRAKKKPTPLVRVAPAERTAIAEIQEVTGEVVATVSVTIQSTVEGPISYCPWREGDIVERAGQRLVQIHRELYRAEARAAEAALNVEKAKARDLKAGSRPEEIAQAEELVRQLQECASFAKTDLARIESLVQSGSLAGESVEKARVAHVSCRTQLAAASERLRMLRAGPTETELAVQEALVGEAEARLALAKTRLDECVIGAPFPGVITRVHVHPGDLAAVRDPLLEMMDPSSLVVRFAVPEADAARIRLGSDVMVTLDALSGRRVQAQIERLFPQLQRTTRTRVVEARVPDDVGLLPGMFARVTVTLRTIPRAVVVDESAVLTTPAGAQIVFVVEDGKAVLRKVTTGIERAGRVEILEGVDPGDRVVVSGNSSLRNGSAVRLPKQPAHDAGPQKSAAGHR